MRIEFRSLRRSVAAAITGSLLLIPCEYAFAQDPAAPPAATGSDAKPETGDAAAPTPPQVDPQELVKQGEAALKAGDYQAALKAYNGLVQVAGQSGLEAAVFAFSGRGQALAGLKEYEAALDDFKQVLDVQPSNVPTLIARGKIYLEQANAEGALVDFQTAIKTDRNNTDAMFGLGKSLMLLGRADEALKPLNVAIAADDKNAEAFRLRAQANASKFKLKEVHDDLQHAIDLDPKNYESYLLFAQVYGSLEEDWPNATEQLKKAIENYKAPEGQEEIPFFNGYIQLASAYIELGKTPNETPERSKAAFKASIDVSNELLALAGTKNPNYAGVRVQAYYSRGIAERMAGDLGAAIKSFSQAIELKPDLAEAFFRRGICFHLLGEERMAISDFEQAAKMATDDPRANLWAGYTYAKLGEHHKALRAYGDAIAASDRYTPAYFNRGLTYLALGEYDKAVADFNEAIRHAPTNANYYYHRGRAYELLKDNKKASESYATALEFDNQHADSYRHLAGLLKAQGKSELAAEYTKKADELTPKNEPKQ